MRERGFDPAHALLVRRQGEGFEILAGHHRAAAARDAGLDAVPCWVRELDDDAAFMALVLANSQSELLPLERGIHALTAQGRATAGRGKKGGLSAYAETVGKTHQLISREVAAAEVWKSATMVADFPPEKIPAARVLAELHAAASWLWPALVSRLTAEGWNVETARGHAGRLKDVPKPPDWADRRLLASAIAAGKARPTPHPGSSGSGNLILGPLTRATAMSSSFPTRPPRLPSSPRSPHPRQRSPCRL
jgi:ParB-like chromosome segregation protein Spo0J